MSARMSTRRVTRLRPRLAGCASGSTPGPGAAVPGRLRASVSTPAAGVAAATSTTSTTASRLGRPRVAASSSTSAGGPPDPPVAAAAEAGVPGAKTPRIAGREALGDLGAFPFGADPGGTPPAPPPFGVNPLSVLKLGRFPAHMSFDMLVDDCPKCKIRGGGWSVSHKGGYGIQRDGGGITRPRKTARENGGTGLIMTGPGRSAPGTVTATPGSGARARPEVLGVVVPEPPTPGSGAARQASEEVLGVVVPGAAANHTTAGGRSGPRDRLPARREPPVPEDRAAQPPRVGVRRVRHPGANPLFHLSPRHPTTSRCSPTMRRGSRRGHLAAFLARRRLSLHPEKTHVASTSSPATFLGFELWPGAGVVGCRRRTCGVRGAEHLGDEVVEAVEVHVGEELARQVADRQPANGPSPLIPPADASGCRSRKACRCTT